MQNEDPSARIAEYREAVQAMRQGTVEWAIPVDVEDEVGKLGEDPAQLAKTLEQKFQEIAKLQNIAEEVTAGFCLDDILSRVYATFRPLIPYDRIGCAARCRRKRCNAATCGWP